MRIAVFGASGFVGSTLIERLLKKDHEELRIFIHSAGSAWRLARHNLNLRFVDILSANEAKEALKGCTHVVNCTRGSDEVMLKGLQNLLNASQIQGIQRFVHLSSVAVYGDPPSPESFHEEAPIQPAPKSYGAIKLQQDTMVKQAHQRGLSSVILCPPNISGVYSPYVTGVLADIRAGTLALLEGGGTIINLVDVENLCYGIELALEAESADGQRMFITDGESVTWKAFIEMLMPLTERTQPLPGVTKEDILKTISKTKTPSSFFRPIKHLVSSHIREALRKDPFWEKIDHSVRNSINLFPKSVEDYLRHNIEGPIPVTKVGASPRESSRYTSQQLRGVYHSCDRAQKILGYQPQYSFQESMERFVTWYKITHGFGTEDWKLARELERGMIANM